MSIKSGSSWKSVNFHSLPTELVKAINVIAVADNLAIVCADNSARLGVNLPHGDGSLTKVVSISFDVLLNPSNVTWDAIDRIEITLACGVERGPKTGTQAHVHLLASGLTVSETFPFGKAESTAISRISLEIPRDAVSRERFPKISFFLVLFAQRNDSTEGVQIVLDTIDVTLRRR